MFLSQNNTLYYMMSSSQENNLYSLYSLLQQYIAQSAAKQSLMRKRHTASVNGSDCQGDKINCIV